MATKILGMTALTKLVDKTKKYVNDKKMINVMNDSSASGNYSVVLGGQGTVPGVCSVSLGGYSNAVNGERAVAIGGWSLLCNGYNTVCGKNNLEPTAGYYSHNNEIGRASCRERV